jgi:hypothetical protein
MYDWFFKNSAIDLILNFDEKTLGNKFWTVSSNANFASCMYREKQFWLHFWLRHAVAGGDIHLHTYIVLKTHKFMYVEAILSLNNMYATHQNVFSMPVNKTSLENFHTYSGTRIAIAYVKNPSFPVCILLWLHVTLDFRCNTPWSACNGMLVENYVFPPLLLSSLRNVGTVSLCFIDISDFERFDRHV